MSPVRSAKEIDTALRKKGFWCKSDGKHVRYSLVSFDVVKMGVNTSMSHGTSGTTVGLPLISLMARQLRLTKSQFLDLIDCNLSEEDYRGILDEGKMF